MYEPEPSSAATAYISPPQLWLLAMTLSHAAMRYRGVSYTRDEAAMKAFHCKCADIHIGMQVMVGHTSVRPGCGCWRSTLTTQQCASPAILMLATRLPGRGCMTALWTSSTRG